MRLDKLNQYIDHYKRFIEQSHIYDIGFKWAATKQFQDNWKLLFTDLPAMYDKSIHNKFIQRYWGNRYETPKVTMLKLINYQPEQVESMFRDLLDESQTLERRIGKFLFITDELLSDYKRTNKDLNNHLHDGFKMLSVYLAFKFPDQYALFDYPVFKSLLEKLGSTNIPPANELERYFKVLRNINKFLHKDETLLAINQKLINRPDFYQEESLLLAQDFVWCCGNPDIKIEQY